MASVNDVVLSAAFLLLSITDFVGNVLVCLIVLQRKRFKFRRSTLDFLFLNLALADIMVAVFAIPRYVLNHAFVHPLGSVGDFLCRFVTGGNLMWTGGAASVYTCRNRLRTAPCFPALSDSSQVVQVESTSFSGIFVGFRLLAQSSTVFYHVLRRPKQFLHRKMVTSFAS